MQTSAEIQTQIAQLESEVRDINKSMTRLSRSQDLIDAMQEVQNRANVIGLLSTRLEEARERETAAAEKARRQANTDAMEQAKAAYDELSSRLNARTLALVKHITADRDETDPLVWELQRLSGEHLEAWLRNNPEKRREDSFSWPKLSSPPLDLTESERHAYEVLGVLFASRHKLPGSYENLNLIAAGAAYQASRHSIPQPQLSNPVTPTADAMAYLDDRMSNGND